MKEPTRLCDGQELPPELRAAFRSLEQGAPSAEAVLRVQRALQALPAVAPGAAAASTFGLTKLALVTTLVAGAVTAVVLAGPRVSAPRAASEPHAARQLEAQAPADSAQTSGDDVRHAALTERAPATAAAADTPRLSSVRNARAASRMSVLPGAVRTSAGERTRAEAQFRGDVEPTPAPATVEEPATPAPPAARAPEAETNEATLLAQAKRLAGSDAAEALRRVEALAAQYPQGTFVQERELLAIQLHRRLGHSALAEQLVQRFHERYPNSVYRRTLAP